MLKSGFQAFLEREPCGRIGPRFSMATATGRNWGAMAGPLDHPASPATTIPSVWLLPLELAACPASIFVCSTVWSGVPTIPDHGSIGTSSRSYSCPWTLTPSRLCIPESNCWGSVEDLGPGGGLELQTSQVTMPISWKFMGSLVNPKQPKAKFY